MQVDAIVVGSGLCGSLAANLLEQRGHLVVVLEAGPAVGPDLPGDVTGFQRAVAPATKIAAGPWDFRGPRGYEWHRVRARGGRTLLWGGWMERPPADYFEARKKLGAPWPESLRNLAPWIRIAEQVLSVRSGRSGGLHRKLRSLGLVAGIKRECVLLGQRRMFTAVDLPISSVRSEAAVLRLENLPEGVVVHTSRGEPVSARRVVLAASPIETARILEASLPLSVRRSRFEIADHLIAGAIAIADRAPVTEHPTDAAEPSAVMHPAPAARFRFTTEVRGPTPLERLDAEDLAALGFTAEQAAQRSFYVVFSMGETDPHAPRKVEFSARSVDGLGRPKPRFVARGHTPFEARLAKQMNDQCLGIARKLASIPSQAFPIYDALAFSSGGHEVGTCLERVDARGEAHDLRGVFVADGAGVPAATDRHPSLTLAANALRVANAVAVSLESPD